MTDRPGRLETTKLDADTPQTVPRVSARPPRPRVVRKRIIRVTIGATFAEALRSQLDPKAPIVSPDRVRVEEVG
jgi:hypothetical protein